MNLENTEALLARIRNCSLCAEHLTHPPRPIIQLHPEAKILVAGQAPGIRVHQTGVPFNDPSGDRLRDWLAVSRQQFYDPRLFALVPMGLCYPGKGASGDLPPRPECSPAWREQILSSLGKVQLTLVLGQYAQQYHLGEPGMTVTERVKAWRNTWPEVLALPHPSPRNNIWLRRNDWFEAEVIPQLQKQVATILNQD